MTVAKRAWKSLGQNHWTADWDAAQFGKSEKSSRKYDPWNIMVPYQVSTSNSVLRWQRNYDSQLTQAHLCSIFNCFHILCIAILYLSTDSKT